MSEKPKNKLSAKQQAFCREYIKDYNATQAAIRAGYASKYADRQGHQLIENNRVKAEIDRLLAEIQAETEITRQTQLDALQSVLKLATDLNKPAAVVSAIREMNEMLGFHRELAPNVEKEAAKAARMTDAEHKLARKLGKELTKDETRLKLVPAIPTPAVTDFVKTKFTG